MHMMSVCTGIMVLAKNKCLRAQMVVRIDGTCIHLWLWYVISCSSIVLILMITVGGYPKMMLPAES